MATALGAETNVAGVGCTTLTAAVRLKAMVFAERELVTKFFLIITPSLEEENVKPYNSCLM
jgi:hypothetical protein